MSAKGDGGPAYPAQEFVQGFDEKPPVMAGQFQQGLSARDYFAAKAMQSLILDPWYQNMDRSEMATALAGDAYEMADAMLEQRER